MISTKNSSQIKTGTKSILFEVHFESQWKNNKASVDATNKAKWMYWELLRKILTFKANILEDARQTIDRRMKRNKISIIQNEVMIQCARIHRPLKLEEDIQQQILLFDPSVTNILVCDIEDSVENNSFLVYMEMPAQEHTISPAVVKRIQQHIQTKHQANATIVCLKNGTLTKHGSVEDRFSFRDQVIMKHFDEQILSTCFSTEYVGADLENDEDDGIRCRTCFPPTNLSSLSFESLDIVTERLLDISTFNATHFGDLLKHQISATNI